MDSERIKKIILQIQERIEKDKRIMEQLERNDNGSIKYPGDEIFMKFLIKCIKSSEEEIENLKSNL